MQVQLYASCFLERKPSLNKRIVTAPALGGIAFIHQLLLGAWSMHLLQRSAACMHPLITNRKRPLMFPSGKHQRSILIGLMRMMLNHQYTAIHDVCRRLACAASLSRKTRHVSDIVFSKAYQAKSHCTFRLVTNCCRVLIGSLSTRDRPGAVALRAISRIISDGFASLAMPWFFSLLPFALFIT